jgi:DNA-binding NarL/FixJ family response regulator
MMKKTSVVIADDNSMMRYSLRKFLSLEENIIILGEAENGEEALRLVEALTPDLLLLDLQMPGLNGLEVTSTIQNRQSPVMVLIISAQDDSEYIRCGLSLGASGYLTKEEAPEFLLQAIRELVEGKKKWLSPRAESNLSFTA